MAQSGTLEVDLLFPRNGTWKPTAILPIVFAVQQPQLGILIQKQVIRWRFRQNNNSSASAHEGTTTFDLNSTTPGLYLATGFSDAFANVEGLWGLQWQVSLRNCSEISSEHAIPSFSSFSESIFMHFRTNNSAPTPNLETALSLDSCHDLDSLAFSVSAIQNIRAGSEELLSTTCAALGDSPMVAGSPCSVTIDAAASASASAAISYSVCQATSTACAAPSSSTKPLAATRLGKSWTLCVVILAIVGGVLF
jgi:hypothetical protein